VGQAVSRVAKEALLVGLVVAGAGCATAPPPTLAPYREALAATAADRLGLDGAERESVRSALDHYLVAFGRYSEATIAADVRALYTADAYFNDQIKELRSAEAIAAYLERSASYLIAPAIEIEHAVIADGEAYVRWTMEFHTRRRPTGEPTATRGISHLRFNRSGRITFHVDTWDVGAAVYEGVPVLGTLVRAVRRRL